MTFKMSLVDWKKSNILSREISLYEKYTKLGTKVNIITYGDNRDRSLIKNKNINVIPIFSSKFSKIFFKNNILNFLYSIFFLIKNKNFLLDTDIIKTNQILGSHLAIFLKKLIKKKLIIRMGYEPYLQNKAYSVSLFKNFYLKFYCYVCIRFADHLCITTDFLKDKIIKTYNIKKDIISVLPNFIDTDKFKNLNFTHKKKFFSISRFDKQKNLPRLFLEISKLDLSLDFYGPKDNAKHFLDIAKKFNCELNYKKNVYNENLPKIINNYEIFILLSKVEGNPKALLEAMSCERIVIGSNVEGIKNIITDKVNGFIFDLKKDNLREILQEIKRYNLKTISKNARKYVVLNHDLSQIIKKEQKILSKVLKNEN